MDYIKMQSGGFPVTTKTFDFLKDSYNAAIGALTSFGGTTYILNGVVNTAGNVSAGFIVHLGEVLPFDASVFNATVSIIETIEQVPYNEDLNPADGNLDLKDGYITRKAICGTGLPDTVATFNFTDLKPAFFDFFSKYFSNVILPYVGLIANIPVGFQLCDGTNGTPDMSGAFVVGYDPNDTDYDAVAKAGGAKDVTLTEAQMPQHNHSGTTGAGGAHTPQIPLKRGENDGGSSGEELRRISASGISVTIPGNAVPSHTHAFTTGNKGSSQSHENRPPYFTVAYMTFVG